MLHQVTQILLQAPIGGASDERVLYRALRPFSSLFRTFNEQYNTRPSHMFRVYQKVVAAVNEHWVFINITTVANFAHKRQHL